ncbi:helix-turn-helix domain-containing protein [Streptomyces sp. CMB-StM0423]|uniref:helix-turn-helix domain-containing protein n=1 Tax=Streptomyces sp. CMB-StM0423 TaxID=2059884 RepID=UPI000C707068|nr:helix-turn-helix domain-containing protein [Streptomyces sp. CMB-StM0423]AUH44901.1 hypothetical protein CXR04_14540 [Streptomyces sp. CMB-StM0423]
MRSSLSTTRKNSSVSSCDAGSNPFEMGIATELFGLRRPELDVAWYDFTLCAPVPGVRMHDGFFTLSRRLVFAAHRDGGQRQFIERPVPAVPDASLAPVLAWAAERLDRPLAVADLAGYAAVSPATLHRRFVRELGTTPLAWLTGERVALACRLIERGEHRLEVVARTSGLGTAANLLAQVRRRTGLSPSAYRARFGPAGAAGPGGGSGPAPVPVPGPAPVPEKGSGPAPRPC